MSFVLGISIRSARSTPVEYSGCQEGGKPGSNSKSRGNYPSRTNDHVVGVVQANLGVQPSLEGRKTPADIQANPSSYRDNGAKHHCASDSDPTESPPSCLVLQGSVHSKFMVAGLVSWVGSVVRPLRMITAGRTKGPTHARSVKTRCHRPPPLSFSSRGCPGSWWCCGVRPGSRNCGWSNRRRAVSLSWRSGPRFAESGGRLR